ncbi:hypothetical protein BJ964_009390 [Actinoplanes lobatus]|uniref:Uncharacterized protein n=1 Tax=Actinoplanes lobatus TaxID=113568 RepID=A0A7W7HRC9_9ACTN|nr:hypothetical protein [Actinoplanes lobatus]
MGSQLSTAEGRTQTLIGVEPLGLGRPGATPGQRPEQGRSATVPTSEDRAAAGLAGLPSPVSCSAMRATRERDSIARPLRRPAGGRPSPLISPAHQRRVIGRPVLRSRFLNHPNPFIQVQTNSHDWRSNLSGSPPCISVGATTHRNFRLVVCDGNRASRFTLDSSPAALFLAGHPEWRRASMTAP